MLDRLAVAAIASGSSGASRASSGGATVDDDRGEALASVREVSISKRWPPAGIGLRTREPARSLHDAA